MPTLYKAYQTNFDVYFFDENGAQLEIYITKDVNGEEIKTNCIDGSEVFANAQAAIDHLDEVLKVTGGINGEGLYNYLSGKKFKEDLGEYYQNDSENTPEANKITRRVITYTRIN